jgi:hypothetical protein
MADQTEVLDATGEITPVASETNEVNVASYSADDLAKAREQEKAKLYPQDGKNERRISQLEKEG